MAQSMVGSSDNWVAAASAATSVGFAIWYAYHTTTKTLPEMNAQHARTIETLVDAFRAEAKEQRDLYRADTIAFWDEHRSEIKLVNQSLSNLAGAMSSGRGSAITKTSDPESID